MRNNLAYNVLMRLGLFVFAIMACILTSANATPFTTTIPDGNGSQIPNTYPDVGGTLFVLEGANGNYYYQFVNPSTQFQGYQHNGQPAGFRGNPFQLGPSQNLNCGPTPCTTYFGGSIAKMYVRVTARDGDACAGNFDFNRITFRVNGTTVGDFSNANAETTNRTGTTSYGPATCFPNQGSTRTTTGWFESTNPTVLNSILTTGQTTPEIFDTTPNNNYWFFRDGNDATGTPEVAPGITIDKTADVPSYANVGDVINYSFLVKNIGSVRLDNVVITDSFIAGAVSCPQTTLLSATQMTCTAQHIVTQANIDDDIVFVNRAEVQANPTEGTLGNVTGEVTIPGPPANNSMTITKQPSINANANVGDLVTYTYVVKNTGNITLDNVTLSDVHAGSGTLSGITPAPVTLAPDASQTFTADYTVTQADVDAQTTIDNTATASATPKRGTITEPNVTAQVGVIPATPALTLSKSTTSTDYTAVGDLLVYSYEVTNTGNVSTAMVVTVSDDKISAVGGSVSCPALPATGLAPLASITCTASYPVTQADIDAGSVTNTASATDGVATSNTDSATVNGTQAPALTLDKRLTGASPTSFSAVGDTILYEFEVTNSGNTTITAPITVADSITSGPAVAVICPALPAGGLVPTASLLCSASYPVDQADIDRGSVINDATASSGPTDSNSDSVTVNAIQTPSMALTKTAQPIALPAFIQGAIVTYDYVVTNDGNTTITDPVSISDNRISTITCDPLPAGGLLPTATLDCQATYTVTTNDVALGSVTNVATVTDGTTTSPQASETTPTGASPAISLTKSTVTGDFNAVNDVINYSFSSHTLKQHCARASV